MDDHGAARPQGLTNLGIVTVDALGEALALAAIGLALTPLALLGPRRAPSRRKE